MDSGNACDVLENFSRRGWEVQTFRGTRSAFLRYAESEMRIDIDLITFDAAVLGFGQIAHPDDWKPIAHSSTEEFLNEVTALMKQVEG
jgi:hypothetical protein